MQRVAMLSVHTSPLAQPGSGDGGGMNVYVHALASALARAGVGGRRAHPSRAPGATTGRRGRARATGSCTSTAGPCAPVPRHMFPELVAPFSEAARAQLERCGTDYDVAARELLGLGCGRSPAEARARPAARHHVPLARPGAGRGRPRRRGHVATAGRGRGRACADLVVAATDEERDQLVRYYGADPERVEIVPPGVDHARSRRATGPAPAVRSASTTGPVLLFVGRIQPLKGVDLAVEALAELETPRATLLVVGGPSGPRVKPSSRVVHRLVEDLGLEERVRFVPPQPHEELATYYRAADVCIVPSRTESFGLVALEAAACGTPVVAANVGGLRFVVDDGAPATSSTAATRSTSRRRSTASCAAMRARWASAPSSARPATAGASPRRGFAVSTPTSPPARSCSAPDRRAGRRPPSTHRARTRTR